MTVSRPDGRLLGSYVARMGGSWALDSFLFCLGAKGIKSIDHWGPGVSIRRGSHFRGNCLGLLVNRPSGVRIRRGSRSVRFLMLLSRGRILDRLWAALDSRLLTQFFLREPFRSVERERITLQSGCRAAVTLQESSIPDS